MTHWAVRNKVNGELIGVPCCDTHPRFHGFAWDGTTMTATNLGDGAPDPVAQPWDADQRTFVDDPEAQRLAELRSRSHG